ncbi:MAG: rubredoxin [Proteobacteria bacterium]|nr:rubredoxin [Pseudomonadota bacterium]MBU1584143.1 rubredoxin [Pseudomonadota bacterium]MBU2452296.1 rubredoxin [Pseudomonadota bacterium]MBU2630146.1 rubredoxin [Pseudomonadota bacterium]
MKIWQCSVCKYIHRGETPPEKCPVCGVDASRFVEIDEASIPQKAAKRTAPDKKTISAKPLSGDPERLKPPVPPKIETGFEKIQSLLIKHHAHPVSVHTPNGILPAAVIFWLMAWIFSFDLFSKVAFINLIFVVIALPFVIFTGILEWKKKYNGALTTIFKIKILAATLTTVSCLISLFWFWIDPEILSTPKAWVFILINIIMLAAAGIAGHIGGKLVFKD